MARRDGIRSDQARRAHRSVKRQVMERAVQRASLVIGAWPRRIGRMANQRIEMVLMVGRVVTRKWPTIIAVLGGMMSVAMTMGMAVRGDLFGNLSRHGRRVRVGCRTMGQDNDQRRNEQRKGSRQRDHASGNLPYLECMGFVAQALPRELLHRRGYIPRQG